MLRKFRGKSQRKEGCDGLSTHSSDITQAASQAAMANTLRRVPVATKMHPFQAEIGGYQQLRTRSNTDNRRIIPYSKGKFPAVPEASPPDGELRRSVVVRLEARQQQYTLDEQVRASQYDPRLP